VSGGELNPGAPAPAGAVSGARHAGVNAGHADQVEKPEHEPSRRGQENIAACPPGQFPYA
jgi:hypothetical protein